MHLPYIVISDLQGLILDSKIQSLSGLKRSVISNSKSGSVGLQCYNDDFYEPINT